MNGPEHYQKSEQLLRQGWEHLAEEGPLAGAVEFLVAAQVHATLALAAATAIAAQGGDGRSEATSAWPASMHPADFNAWYGVCGVLR